jgi:hypothetical protein
MMANKIEAFLAARMAKQPRAFQKTVEGLRFKTN